MKKYIAIALLIIITLSFVLITAEDLDNKVTQTARKPIILVPGVTGSRLFKYYDPWWSGWRKDLLWVDTNQAIFSPSDDYLDPLRLKPNGRDPLNMPSDEYIMCVKNPRTGNYDEDDINDGFKDQTIASVLYTMALDVWIEMENWLEDNGYELGVNLFYAPHDWRMRVNEQCNVELKEIIEIAKQRSGWNKVDVIAHSMGGATVKAYIESSDTNAANIDRFISVGAPYLGAPVAITKPFTGDGYEFHNPAKIKEMMKNVPSVYQLMPSRAYYTHIINSSAYYFNGVQYDSYCQESGSLVDLDKDGVKNESFDFNEVKNIIRHNFNSSFYNTVNEELHNLIDNKSARRQGIKHYVIATNNIPTPYVIKFVTQNGYLDPQEFKMGPGDGTVPYLSAIDAGNSDINAYYAVQNAGHAGICTDYNVLLKVRSILGLPVYPTNSVTGSSVTEYTSYEDAKDAKGDMNGLVMLIDAATEPEIVDKNDANYHIAKKYDEISKTYVTENTIGKGSYIQKISNLYVVYLPDDSRNYEVKVNDSSIKEMQVRKYTSNNEKILHYFNAENTTEQLSQFEYDAVSQLIK